MVCDPSWKARASQEGSELRYFRRNKARHITSQCPNERAMIVVGNNEYVTTSESDSNYMSPLEDASNDNM